MNFHLIDDLSKFDYVNFYSEWKNEKRKQFQMTATFGIQELNK
jgi:hypothetical protein